MNVLPTVLVPDFNGFWCELSQLYWSQHSLSLVARHPLSCVEEIISLYCPQCLARYSEEEGLASHGTCLSCLECPRCSGILPRADVETRCGTCGFECPSPELYAAKDIKPQLLQALADNLQLGISNANKSSALATPGSYHGGVWQMEDLHQKLSLVEFKTALEDDRQGLFKALPGICNEKMVGTHVASRGADCSQGAPVGVKLRSKRSIRSLPDPRTGRMNILVQPKTLPLEGDSSLKLQRGKWWVKDASAVHELPFVSIQSLPLASQLVHPDSGGPVIQLSIVNPKVSEVTIAFSDVGQAAAAQTAEAPFRWLSKLGESKVVHADKVVVPAPIQGGELRLCLGAYEDELLKDATSATTLEGAVESSSLSDGDAEAGGWKYSVLHNKAIITIPLSLRQPGADSASREPGVGSVKAAEFVLSLDCTVDLGGGSILDFPIRVLFE